MKNVDEKDLFKHLQKYAEIYKKKLPENKLNKIKKSLGFLKNKAKTLEDIFNNSKYLLIEDVEINLNDLKLIDNSSKDIIKEFVKMIESLKSFERNELEPIVQALIKKFNTNFKGVGQPLRILLTGSRFGPGIYDILTSLGKDEVQKRLKNN